MFIGVALALIATVIYNAGMVLEKRALDDLPTLSLRKVGRLLRALVTSRAWLSGFLVMAVGLMCQVVALSLVPLSVAQPIQLAGLALLIVFSAVFLGERVTPREWAALGVLAGSLTLICLSMEPTPLGLHAGVTPVLTVSAGTAIIGLGVFAAAVRSGRRPTPGLMYGAAAGLLYGVASLQTKGVAGFLAEDPHGFAARTLHSPYPYIYLVASAIGLLLFQTGLQRGRASIVVPVSTVVGSVYTVLAGTAVFGEPLPQSPVRMALRTSGFALALVVVALMPRQDEETDQAPVLLPDRVA